MKKNEVLIKKIVEKLKKEYRPKRVILFGSYAYGKPSNHSDVDLLIIKETSKKPLDRWSEVKRILRGVSPFLPVSPFVYTEREIRQRQSVNDFFIEEILTNGKVLYDN